MHPHDAQTLAWELLHRHGLAGDGLAAGNGTAGNGTAGNGTAGNGTAGNGTAGYGTAGYGTAGNGTAGGWRFRFDHARRRFGSCRYRQKLITLSRPLTILNPEEQVRDTLLHEIAHALTPGDGHGARWKRKCREIGARPQRCYTDASVLSPPRRPAPYQYGCPACDWWVERRRLMAGGRFVCRPL